MFEVLAAIDLPATDDLSHELSGIAWDERQRVLLAVCDEVPRIVMLRPSADLRSWRLDGPVAVAGVMPWDGEGLAAHGGHLFLANERPPRVVELDDALRVRREIPLPAHFGSCRPNRCLESLSITPDGRFLFTANEASLACDGPPPNASAGSTVRIVGVGLDDGALREWAYTTDPVSADGRGGEIGVADLVAMSSTRVLVLERSYIPEVKNTIRIYDVHLPPDKDIAGLADASLARPVAKKLVLDLDALERDRPFHPNYEGMCLGPELADGRRVLFLISDDNARSTQIARLLVLATANLVPPQAP